MMDPPDLGFVDTAQQQRSSVGGGSAAGEQLQRADESGRAAGNIWPLRSDIANIVSNGSGGVGAAGTDGYMDDVDDIADLDQHNVGEVDDDEDDDLDIDDEMIGGDRGVYVSNRSLGGEHEYLDIDEEDGSSPLGAGGDSSLLSGSSALNSSEAHGFRAGPPGTSGGRMDSAATAKSIGSLLAVDIGNADIDIDSLVQPYVGLTRIKHLRFIASRCPRLAREALRAAMTYVKNETDMFREYESLVSELQALETSSSTAVKDVASAKSAVIPSVFADTAWAEFKRTESQARFERLDSDLKNYKANAIKESTRRGYIDLGDYYMRIGDVDNAIRQYVKSRDYASDIKHIINACEKILKAAVINQSWGHVETYASVLDSVLESNNAQQQQQSSAASRDAGNTASGATADDSGDASAGQTSARDQRYRASVDELRKLALALRFFTDNNYSRAAEYFLALNPDFHDNPNINELVAPKDIALYGLLCALVTRSRADLKQKIFPGASGGSSTTTSTAQNRPAKPAAAKAGGGGEKSAGSSSAPQQQQMQSKAVSSTHGFKSFLAEEPAARVIAESYRDGNYSECIGLLQRNRPNYLLDPYLSAHITTLTERIRQKGMIEYFCAYKKVFIATMAKDFVLGEPELENELVRLICDGQMNAYIDMSDRSLRRREVDSAAENKAKLVELLRQNEQTLTHTMLHVDLLRNNIAIPEEKQQQQHQSHLRGFEHEQMPAAGVGGGGAFEFDTPQATSREQPAAQQQQQRNSKPFFGSFFGAGEPQQSSKADFAPPAGRRGMGRGSGMSFFSSSTNNHQAAQAVPAVASDAVGGSGSSMRRTGDGVGRGGASSSSSVGDLNNNNSAGAVSLSSKDSGMSLDTIGESDDAMPTGFSGKSSAGGSSSDVMLNAGEGSAEVGGSSGSHSVAATEQPQQQSSSSGGGGVKGFLGSVFGGSSNSGGGSSRGART